MCKTYAFWVNPWVSSAHTLRMFGSRIEDQHLEDVFQNAAEHAPAVVLLEDLDRAFPRNGSSRSKINLQ